MFATWKYDRETSEVHNIRLAYDPISARSSQHQACDRCHEKKLKCSGDKDGCDRCVTASIRCEYNRGESRSSKSKRSRRCSTDSLLSNGTISRNGSQPGSPPSRAQRCHKSSQTSSSKRKSSLNARARSSTEPLDIEFSPRQSTATSIAGSPYSLASFATTVSDSTNYSTGPPVSSPYDTTGISATSSMPFQAASYREYSYPASSWSSSYPRDPLTSADISNAFVPTSSDPHVYPVLTPPDDFSQFQGYTPLPALGADLWPYRR